MMKSAKLSEDGLYRYELSRQWVVGGPSLCWVMLNPSTADAERDDPTIRRVVAFSQAWGFAGAIFQTQDTPFFVVQISKPIWEHLSEKQQEALVDHELCHCKISDDGSLWLEPHNVEEFSEIVGRYGLWSSELTVFFAEYEQLQLSNVGVTSSR